MGLKQIKEKLIADCSQCDALCCNAPKFKTATYNKEAGVQCKNLDDKTLRCQIYDDREERGYSFCLTFDCHGAGQAVTKLFQDLGHNWQDNKTIAKIQYDIFIATYHHLSHHFFQGRKVQDQQDQSAKEELSPFVDKAITILGNQINENLGQFIDTALNQIKSKLISDCSQCDALCCKIQGFENPTYKKKVGMQCKNLNDKTLGCQIYNDRKQLEYNFCINFECHGAGQAVTKLFRSLRHDNKNDKITENIKLDVFIATYHYISGHFFSDQETQIKIGQPTKENLIPFVDKAISILGADLDETL